MESPQQSTLSTVGVHWRGCLKLFQIGLLHSPLGLLSLMTQKAAKQLNCSSLLPVFVLCRRPPRPARITRLMTTESRCGCWSCCVRPTAGRGEDLVWSMQHLHTLLAVSPNMLPPLPQVVVRVRPSTDPTTEDHVRAVSWK